MRFIGLFYAILIGLEKEGIGNFFLHWSTDFIARVVLSMVCNCLQVEKGRNEDISTLVCSRLQIFKETLKIFRIFISVALHI